MIDLVAGLVLFVVGVFVLLTGYEMSRPSKIIKPKPPPAPPKGSDPKLGLYWSESDELGPCTLGYVPPEK